MRPRHVQIKALVDALWEMTSWAAIQCGHERVQHSVTSLETCEEAYRSVRRILGAKVAKEMRSFEFLIEDHYRQALARHGEEAFWEARISSARRDMVEDLEWRAKEAA